MTMLHTAPTKPSKLPRHLTQAVSMFLWEWIMGMDAVGFALLIPPYGIRRIFD